MDLNILKILGAFLLWIIALGSGLVPILVPTFKSNKLLISFSQCFAGGLFIAIGLIHILPEARENLEGSWEKEPGETGDVFPLSYFLCLMTFSMILLIDKVLFNNSDIIEDIESKADFKTSMLRKSILGGENDPEENFQERVSTRLKLAVTLSQLGKHKGEEFRNGVEEEYLEIPDDQIQNDDLNNQSEQNRITEVRLSFPETPIEISKSLNVENLNHSLNKSEHIHFDYHHDQKHDHGEHNHKKHTHAQKHDDHGHHHASVKKGNGYTSAMIILTAMGIHGLFEGLAMGVEKEESSYLNMFIAVLAHKWCDSLIVGFSFVGADLPKRMSLFLTIFLSLFTPAGIFIGYLEQSNRTVTGIFQALSSGTFIYISCAEIIIEEFAIAKHKFMKFLMYSLGILFVVMIGMLE